MLEPQDQTPWYMWILIIVIIALSLRQILLK